MFFNSYGNSKIQGTRLDSLVPRPIPSFSMLHAEKQEGLLHVMEREGPDQLVGQRSPGL